MLGNDQNEESIAAAVDYNDEIDTAQILKKYQVLYVPWNLVPDKSVWVLMMSDQRRAEARSPGSRAFTFVDFASSELLPAYITPDMVGGKVGIPGDENGETVVSENKLTELSKALKAATGKPKFLRSHNHWHAVFGRFCLAAVGSGQWSHTDTYNYRDQFINCCEKARIEGLSMFIPLLYDIMHRMNIAKRWRRNDQTLDITMELKEMDKQTWEAAKQRIAQVLHACDVTESSTPGVASSPAAHMGAHTSAVEEFRKQAQEAGDALARQNQQFLQQQQEVLRQMQNGNWRGDTSGNTWSKGNSGKGGGKPLSKKQQKSQQYVSWIRSVKKHNGKQRGGNRGNHS